MAALAGWGITQWGFRIVSDATQAEGFGGPSNDAAVVYARAVQDGHCERVIALARWMQERVAYVSATGSGPRAAEEARDEICADLQDRPVERNVLTREGIDDKYAFPPGATIAAVRRDKGRGDLDAAVDHRTWVRVEYPVERYAPRSEDGRAIRAMVVGVNVSPDGLIVKAGVLGNVEVDQTSLEFEGPTLTGE